METLDLIDTAPVFYEPAQIFSTLIFLTETRHLLLKKGKILGRRVFRYFVFHNESLIYYLTRKSIASRGSIDLRKCIAIPLKSTLSGYSNSIKVLTANFNSEFFLFAKSEFECSQMMLYLRLASNDQIKNILDIYCSNQSEDELKPLKESDSYKSTQIEPVITTSRRTFAGILSPTSEGEFDAPEENAAFSIPTSKVGCGSHNVSMNENLSMIEEDAEESYMKSTHEKSLEFKIPSRGKNGYELPEIQSPENIREAGLKYMWNFQLENAKNCFSLMKNCDLRCSLHYAEVNLFRVLVTGRKSDVLRSSDALAEVERMYTTLADSYSEIIVAETNLFKSILLFVSGQKLKAFICMRSAWKLFRKYENSLSTIKDEDLKGRVIFGLGLFMLIVSLVPSSISTILKLAGFTSNKERGLELLYKCREMKISRSPFAALILGLFYIDMEPDIDKSKAILDQGLAEFPGCVLFHWVNSIVAWKLNKVDVAVRVLQDALHCCGKDLEPLAAFIKYELGWFHFLRMDWYRAREQFESILCDTLSLSSELDSFVKEALTYGDINEARKPAFEELFFRRVSTKKKTKTGWLEGPQTPSHKDRVYIPHKACLIAQLAGCLAALKDTRVTFWLKVTKISACTPSASRTKLDEEFGGLAQVFLYRQFTDLLPFEVIYFLKQHTKLLPDMLNTIFVTAEHIIQKLPKEPTGSFLVEFCSAKMLQIMALCLNGDTEEASEISDDLVLKISGLPPWGVYLAPHSLYWISRAYNAELRYEDAVNSLEKARKIKKYHFNIRGKISRVMYDIKNKIRN
ncbi:unnamed protein product [Blepharisma stoltei]|uniref:PH domain-containing protein n=1 Tax=Blepharisma stoltei TaxID=1481888 RepID=A0AAU9K027_9CILI|nr:unnamed protein product [Blepharisma stoltei]